jgi:FMN phosphatase YigB (HAD superfamily)
MLVDAVIFDFCGTLDTDGVSWREAFWEAYQASAIDLERPLFDAAYLEAERHLAHQPLHRAAGLTQLVDRHVALQVAWLKEAALPLRLSEWRERMIRDRFLARIAATVARVRPLLRDIARSRVLAVAADFYGNIDSVLGELRLRAFMHTALDASGDGGSTTRSDIYCHVARLLRTSPVRCVVVGDSYERDVIPAKDAGCRTVWLRASSGGDTPAAAADMIIATLHDLPSTLAPEGPLA